MKQPSNDCFFNSIVQYNQKNIEKINKICAPLKQCFNISYFGYCRVFNSGSYILLSNSPVYLEAVTRYDYLFNSRYFQHIPKLFSKYELYKLIWPENTGDELVERLHAQKIYNGFNINKVNNGTLETYFFATDKDHSLIKELYEKHSSLLVNFITHFHKIGGDLCDASDLSNQGVSPYLKEIYPRIEDIFDKTTLWDKKIIEFNELLNSKAQEEIYEIGKKNSLTHRELQCLSYFSTGKTAKEIARAINIGPRTAETYIANIRLKTKLQTKSELIHWFEDTFRHFLINAPLSDQLLPRG